MAHMHEGPAMSDPNREFAATLTSRSDMPKSESDRSIMMWAPTQNTEDTEESFDLDKESAFDREISPCSACSALSEVSHVSASRRRVSESLAKDFIRAASVEQEALTWKRRINGFRTGLAFSNFMALVIFVDAYSNCRDIDARAAAVPAPLWIAVLSDACLVIYTLEAGRTERDSEA